MSANAAAPRQLDDVAAEGDLAVSPFRSDGRGSDRASAAARGAVRGWIRTYIPYIRDAGIAHILSILSPRGGEHHQRADS